MSRKVIILPMAIILMFGFLLLGLVPSCGTPTTSTKLFGDRIGLLYIEGMILSGKANENPFVTTGASSDHIVEVVKQAIDDKGIKALVVRVNSPGGSAAASEEIYNILKEFSATGRPVIVSMGDVAASGGYYISSAADEIFASSATLTGSIGVIMQFMNIEGLYKLIGLNDETLKAGKFKDIGSGTRPMTDEEKKILQSLLDGVHKKFKDDVMAGRGFTQEEIDKIATGMVFTGQQALDNRLIDKLGGIREAIQRAGEMTGLGASPVVDELGKVGILDQLLGDVGMAKSSAAGPLAQIKSNFNPLAGGGNPFYQLWSIVLLDPRFMGEDSGIRF